MFAVALPVVIDTSVPELREVSIELAFKTVVWVGSKLAEYESPLAVFEIVTSNGSISHIPPRPTLIVAKMLTTCPEVSTKPPFVLLKFLASTMVFLDM